MALEDVVLVSQITIISRTRISRISSQIRHEVNAKCLWEVADCANALTAADAAATRAGIDGTCSQVIDRRCKQQIWTVVVDRTGYGFARGDKLGPRIVTANEIISAAVEVDMGCNVDPAEHLDCIGVVRDRQ